MKPTYRIERLIKRSRYKATTETYGKSLHSFLQAVDDYRKQQSALNEPSVRRIIMNTKITKLAVAAMIIIAVLIGINQFDGSVDMASVVWADVAERVQQIQTYIHRTTQTLVDPTKSSISMVYYSAEHGKKIEVYKDDKIIMYVYVRLEEKAAISIMPDGKKVQKTPLTEKQLLDELQGGDPRSIVRQFMAMKYKELGDDEIDGIKTEVIEVENPEIVSDMYVSSTGRLWVDVETNLPVRIEIDGTAKGGLGQMTMVLDKLQWNVDLDADQFRPNIPSDYTVIEE